MAEGLVAQQVQGAGDDRMEERRPAREHPRKERPGVLRGGRPVGAGRGARAGAVLVGAVRIFNKY